MEKWQVFRRILIQIASCANVNIQLVPEELCRGLVQMHGDRIRTSVYYLNDFLSFLLTSPGLILPIANAFLELVNR